MTLVLSSEEQKTIENFQIFLIILNANVLFGIDHITDLRQCYTISTWDDLLINLKLVSTIF